MIGGFNTDIVLDGVVYHIQTEDRGDKIREIVTQVFREGAVILTRRTPYPATVIESKDASELEALVRNQHIKLLNFIRGGGLKKDEFLQKRAATLITPEVEQLHAATPPVAPPSIGEKSSVAAPTPNTGQEEFRKTRGLGSHVTSALRQVSAKHTMPPAPPDLPGSAGDATQIFGSDITSQKATKPIPRSSMISRTQEPTRPPAAPPPDPDKTEGLFLDEFLRDLAGEPRSEAAPNSATALPVTAPSPTSSPLPSASPQPTVVPAPAAIQEKIPTPAAAANPASFAQGEKCEIHLLSSRTIRSGEVQLLSLRLQSDQQGLPLPDARVVVRIFGKTIRPITFSGRSDQQGIFKVEILVPHYTIGDGHVEVQVHSILGSRTLVLDVAKATASK